LDLLKKKDLHRRRVAHLKLLGAGNSLQTIVQTLTREFNCSEKAIYSDNKRIAEWSPIVGEDEKTLPEIKARYRLVNRVAINLMLDEAVKNGFVKVAAIHAVLKLTRDQIKLWQDLGLITRAPITIKDLSTTTPFESDPVLREALELSIEKQKAEKEAQEKLKGAKYAAAPANDCGT
jgi:hypothetical protein